MSPQVATVGHGPLRNAPLVEVIFEARWSLDGQGAPGQPRDPHYRLLPGTFYGKARVRYPVHEPLDAAQIPYEMIGGFVQHRFRAVEGGWPLVQLGPGILTVNQTIQSYGWADFSARVVEALGWLRDCYSAPRELPIASVVLRYIDALAFDAERQDISEFLRSKMRVQASLPADLFAQGAVGTAPRKFNFLWTFPSQRPEGEVSIRLVSGTHAGSPALLWETWVESTGACAEAASATPGPWLEAVHSLTSDSFRALIKGELEQGFRNG